MTTTIINCCNLHTVLVVLKNLCKTKNSFDKICYFDSLNFDNTNHFAVTSLASGTRFIKS